MKYFCQLLANSVETDSNLGENFTWCLKSLSYPGPLLSTANIYKKQKNPLHRRHCTLFFG